MAVGDVNKSSEDLANQGSRPEMKSDQLTESVIEIVVECWRFSRLFVKVANRLDAGEAAKYVSQLRYFQKKIDDILERFDLKLINLEGHPYEPGMAVVALNIDEFETDDRLIIDQMSEPVVMDSNGLKKMGAVILRRV
jgi:hypothetical protein